MPLPEQDILQRGDELAAQRDPGFVTEKLPSPDLQPYAVPGTGQFEYGDAQSQKADGLSQDFINKVLGAQDRVTPGKLPSYTASEVYNPRYRSILPGEDSEEAFAKGQSWYKQWGNAIVKFGATTAGTFANGMMAIPDTIASISGGSPYDTNMGNDIDSWLKNLENEFPNYYTKWQQDHPFMSALPFSGGFSNFWGDKILKNVGFTIGAIGSAVATEYLLTAGTAGIGSIPGLSNSVGRTALLLNKVFTGTDRLATLGRLGAQAGRTTEQILNVERLAAAAAATKVANGTKYALALYGSAASEAGFEAREGYNTVKNELLTAYQRENGYSPIGKDLEDLENYARDAANTRFGANLALLSISNAVQFDSILKPWNIARTGVRGTLQRELSQSGIGLADKSIDTFEKTAVKGIAPKIWTKIKPAVPSILSEGIFEEGGQYAAQVATENYYTRKFLFDKGISSKQYEKDETPWNAKDQVDNVLHSIVKGMADEFGTLEGQENIFIGGIIGAMSAGVEHFVDRNKNQRQIQATLNILNSQGVTGTFQDNYESTIHAYRIAEDMRKAAETGDIFKYKNFQNEAFTNFVVSGIKAGRFDVRIMQLDMLKDMSNDEFKKAFGLDKTTDTVKTVDQYVSALKDRAQVIKKNYDLINDTFENPYVLRNSIQTPEQAIENQKHHHFEGWKDQLVYLSTILPDVNQRLNDIGTQVKDIFSNTNTQQIAGLTNRKTIKEFQKNLRERAKNLQAALDTKLSVDRPADEKELKALNRRIDNMSAALNDPDFKGDKFEKFFHDMLNYMVNGETEKTDIVVPTSAIPKLIELGVDINRLNEFKESANKAFDALSTEEGFNKYFNEVQREQEKQAAKAEKQQPGQKKNEEPARKVIKIKDAQGGEKEFEEGVDYFIKLDSKPDSNPQKVKIIGQTEDGVTVQTEDGTQVLVPNDVFFAKDAFSEEVKSDLNSEVSSEDQTSQSPPGENGTQVGDSMKDLSFGTFSTTDPTYNRKDIPFNNFHRRHQNFLFNLGSSDPKVFNQDNRHKLRIIPVTAQTAAQFGFPAAFTEGSDSVDNATIRAVYVIDDRMSSAEKQKQRDEIVREVQKDEGIGTLIKGIFKSNPEQAIDDFYQQLQSGEVTREETILSLGEDIVTLIEDYKSEGLYYVNENGEKLGSIRQPADPNELIFSNFSSTELTYEGRGGTQPRYTNKQNLDEKKVQDWWREQRKAILEIKDIAAVPLYQFDVSRGLPNIINYDFRNPVVETKLIRQEDLDNPIITIPTVGNVANVGAYNSMGQGIAAAKAGTNMPLGTPLLNFGGNMVFLNGRTFSPPEARNVIGLLKIASDRSTGESRKGIFSYLNKIIHMGNPERGVKATNSSITITGNALYLGTSTDPIQFTPSAIEESKERIFDFLLKTYQGVKNAELLRIAKNPKANDLQFNELGVEEGKVVIVNKWKNYNYYLLSAVDAEGKKRGQPPLTTNIAVPVEGEVPVIQKYAVLKNMDFDAKLYEATTPKPTEKPREKPKEKPATQPKATESTEGQVAAIEKLRQEELAKAGDAPALVNLINRKYNARIAALSASLEAEKKADVQQGVETKQEEKAKPKVESKVEETEEAISWVQIGQSKYGFSGVVRDADGNITDLKPEGLVQADGSITPYHDPNVVKSIILSLLKKSQPTKDETNTAKPSWLGNKNLKKGDDDQYRQFQPGESYAIGDVNAEFREAERMLGDEQLFVKVQHILKTTSGGLAYGAFIDNVIYVWQGAKVGTTYHEVFEKVWGTFLTGKEQQDLYDEFISREGKFNTFGKGEIPFSAASMWQAKEQIAEEFTEFILSGKLPSHKRQRNFFQRLWDFIKKVIFGTEGDINHLFKRINKGYYRNFSTSLRGPLDPQYREAELSAFSEAFIQDTLQGMTIEMFMQAYREASDIVAQMEDNAGIPVTSIYEKLKANLTRYFEETGEEFNNTFAAEMNSKYLTLTKDDDRSAFEAQVISILDSWQKIKDKWEAFVDEHKRYLKVFNVEFTVDDDGNISFDEEDVDYDDQNKSQSEYDRDIFKIDAKNSASTKIKLLIATLADSYWKEATRASIGATRSNLIGIKRDNSLVALPKQVQYAKLFNYVLHNTSNINGIYDMWAKMSSMTEDVESRKAIDANLQRLMNRVDFRNGFESKTINQAKLILALENTLAKQKPAFFRQFVDVNNQVFFKTSVLNSKIGQVKASWITDIKGSGAVVPAPNNLFKFSKSVVGIADPINFLAKIGIEIPRKDYNKLNARDKTRFNEAVNVVRELIERSVANDTVIPIISGKQMDFDSRLDDLADLYVSNMVGDDAQSQHPNLENDPTSNFVLNNFVSTVLNDANSSATREEFLSKQDNGYLRDIFHKDSILLNGVLFTPQGDFNRAVTLGVVEGREKWDQNNKSASKLTEAERQLYEINNNLNGVFYTLLPADAKTEWAIHSGTYLSPENFFGDSTSRGNEVTRFANQMYKWLQTEVELARDYENRKDIVALNRKVDGRPVGKSLRFFKDILPKDLVDIIHRDAVDKLTPLGDFFTASGLRPYMVTLLENKAKQTLNNLLDWQVFSVGENQGEYKPNGIDREFLNNFLGQKEAYTQEELLRLFAFREGNYIMSNIDVHKMFFGDPAQYKDELKRIKSFLSGREQTHVDTLHTPQGFNHLANTLLNTASGVQLQPDDPGYHTFKNYAATITVRDITFESSSIDELKEVLGEKADPYTEGNEADAQAKIMPTFYREIMYKAGGRFTAAQERQFQWEMAWERNEKSQQGKYTYSSRELERADKELLKNDPEDVEFPVLKLMHSGIQEKNGVAIASLDKASWAPMFYRWIAGRADEKLYNSLQRKGRDYIRMESAHKVGIQESSLTDLYDSEGNINVLRLDAIQDEYIPLKQFGVQVEQSKKSKGQTEGSQSRKIVTGDLMSNGVPIDFIEKYKDEDTAYNEWNKLTDEEKLKTSDLYSRVRRHDQALINLVETRVERAIKKLGMVEGEEGITIPDKTAISEYILRELERRELPRNIAYGIQTINGEFSQPLEANAQYAKIRQIIYSVIDDTIMRPTVNGGQKTMLSVTGWEKNKRIVKRVVNGKPVFTSNELKFYTQGDGKTEACEVMLPYWFGKMLKDKGSFRTKEEVIKYLNNTAEGRKLISGIGFRIPTQGLNSIDFFVVKDFLPEQMGSVIVLPSEITVKAGSDFDIDKLNIYQRNFYIDSKTGYPKAVEYKGSQEGTMKYLEELLDKGDILSQEEIQELDRIIAEENDELDVDNLMMRIPGVMDLFSDTQITREFLKDRRDYILSKMYLQSLENEFFDAIEDLLSLPTNFRRLVQPNDASEMKGLRTKLLKLKGQDEGKNQLGDFGRLLDSQYMMKERQAYMSSKGVVGTSAVSQVSHAVSQNMERGLLVYTPSIEARFPHNTIDGKITLSGLYTTGTKSYISNINSQTTDGGVDVSKDKFLAEMGITSDTLKDFLALVRMGASPWWATLYLNQPAIQEFLKKKAIHSSVSQINKDIRSISDRKIIGSIQAQFGVNVKGSNIFQEKPKVYTISQMEEMVEKYAQGKALTKEENRLQIMMLDDYTRYNTKAGKYEGYSALGWYLFDFYQGYNWDTARINDPNAIRLKELRYEKANGNPLSPASDVMKYSFIGAMRRGVIKLDEGLKQAISIQQGPGDIILNKLARQIFNTAGTNEQTKRNLLLAAELTMVNYMVQTNAEVAGKSINTYIYPTILGEKAVALYIRAMQRSNDKRLTNNPFIKNLVANIDTRTGYPSIITLGERDYDTYTSNVWTDGFKEMKDDATIISINDKEEDDRTVSQIYKNLVLASILQSGSKRTSNSLSHLIPNETFSQYTAQPIRMMNLEGFLENDVFYRANWANNSLVTKVEMEPYDPEDPFSDMVYPFLDNPQMNDMLKQLTGSNRPSRVLNVIAWKYSRKKAIKILSPLRDDRDQLIGFVPLLFMRIDVGSQPLSIMEDRILFKEINPWGDGKNINEFYRDARSSVLPLNAKLSEATDDQVIYAAYKAGFQMNIAEEAISSILNTFENPGDSTDENDNSSPDPEPVKPGPTPTAPAESAPMEFAELDTEGWKKAGKKETFQIQRSDRTKEDVQGYKITFKDHPDLQAFVHGERGSWTMTDIKSGMAFNSLPQKTIAAAVEDAIERTNKAINSGQNKDLLINIGVSGRRTQDKINDCLGK